MRLRSLAAATGVTLALGLALPQVARADHHGRSYGRSSHGYSSYGRSSYGHSSYGYRAPYAYSPYRASVYPPVYSPYAYDPYYYDPYYYAPTYGPAYFYGRAPVVVYHRPIRRPHVSVRIGF
jgi:hypothetical protein